MRAGAASIAMWLAGLACVRIAAAGEPGPSSVIYPPQQLPIRFSHRQHLALGAGCDRCHRAAESRRAADLDLPVEAVCAACHPIDRAQPDQQVAAGVPAARCAACHPSAGGAGGPPAVVSPPPSLKFNHQLHARRGIACAACHGDLASVDLATRAQLPRMALCLACHDGQRATAACTACHLSDRDGRVRTDLPDGKLIPSGTLRGDAHDLVFRTDHARVAGNDPRYCSSCHTRESCVECHDGVRKPLDFHGNDYVALHALDARRQALDCGGCHRQQTFCTGCHSRTGVGDDPKTTGFRRRSEETAGASPARFHPDGWWSGESGGARGAGDHSFQAQRNLRACASCHREEFCRDCHARDVDPHPAGWAQSRRCQALLARARRTCLRCHAAAEDVRCR